MKFRSLALGLFASVAAVAGVYAASVPLLNPQQCQIPGACIDINQALANVNSNAVGFSSTFVGKNYLDNGDFSITQRGTGIISGATTAGPVVTSYPADRWAIDQNTSTGSPAPRGKILTSAPTPPLGFQNVLSVYRTSGTSVQPILLEQEVKSSRFIQLQGKPVILSCYLSTLAGAGSATTAVLGLITGTGTDDGLGALRGAVGLTATPAITPVWAGVATTVALTQTGLTSTPTRYSSGPVIVPVAATEGAFYVSWTPGAETAGPPAGIAVTGCQLEQADPNQTTASAFEFLPSQTNLQRTEVFYKQWADSLAATFTLPMTCTETTSGTTAACLLEYPTQDLAAPVVAVQTATSFGMTKVADGTAEACTTFAVVASTSTPNNAKLTCAVSETAAVGTMHIGLYANTGAANTLSVSSDF